MAKAAPIRTPARTLGSRISIMIAWLVVEIASGLIPAPTNGILLPKIAIISENGIGAYPMFRETITVKNSAMTNPIRISFQRLDLLA